MEKPSKETIERLKAQFADRSFHLVTLTKPGDEEEFLFVMMGANADEYKRYEDEITRARQAKTDEDRNDKLTFAMKQAVLRRIAWPEAEEAKALLHAHPGFVVNLAEKIHDHAGTTAKVRSEKL